MTTAKITVPSDTTTNADAPSASTTTTMAMAAATAAAPVPYAPRLERQDETLILDILKTSRLIGQVWPVSRSDRTTEPKFMPLLDRGLMAAELNAALAARKADFEVTEKQLRDLLNRICISEAVLNKLIQATGGRCTLGSRWANPSRSGKGERSAPSAGGLVAMVVEAAPPASAA